MEAKNEQPTDAAAIEEKKEVKKEPIENHLKLTYDFKDMIRSQLSIIKQDKEKTELARTQANETLKAKEKEEVELKRHRFGAMKKKPPFSKANKEIEYFSPLKQLVPTHGEYGSNGDLLIAPDRAKAKNAWKTAKHQIGLFNEVPEDLDAKTKQFVDSGEAKYKTLLEEERAAYKMLNEGTFKKSLMDKKLESEKVWKPNSFKKDLFTEVKPPEDGACSIQEQLRLISPDRVYEKKVWNPTKKRLEYFDSPTKKSYS